ncbi:hypothetical protein GCM10010275_25170 [Streptomyces litmocidini]|uniref:sterol desaturase family protein n=1 Tax=Streptomyces litmocidini TaxID=67318 RepID=UPI00167C84F5|nr:hypothetical protein [Streptomyces litmocidini]GGU88220.1 hypothetical protein GCM10010275_25170 [Streptomyces litmocidini]
MPNPPDVVLRSVPAFALLTALETAGHRIHPDEGAAGHEAKDAATGIGTGPGSPLSDALWKIPVVAVRTAVDELTPLRVPVLRWTIPLMPLARDFPSCWRHRGHHAFRGGYPDRNFGGVLIVRDRMFGSWAGETVRPVYGLTKDIATHNPLRVATHEHAATARDLRAAQDWRERAGRVFRGRGRQPAPATGASPAPQAGTAPGAAA